MAIALLDASFLSSNVERHVDSVGLGVVIGIWRYKFVDGG